MDRSWQVRIEEERDMKRKKIHLSNYNERGTRYCGGLLDLTNDPPWTENWKKATCKNCLKKICKPGEHEWEKVTLHLSFNVNKIIFQCKKCGVIDYR